MLTTSLKDRYVVKKTALEAPISLSLTVVSATQITLDWTDVAIIGTIKIERSLAPTSGFVEIASVVLGVETYDNTGLTTATTYYYRIRSYDISIGYSVYSAIENETTL